MFAGKWITKMFDDESVKENKSNYEMVVMKDLGHVAKTLQEFLVDNIIEMEVKLNAAGRLTVEGKINGKKMNYNLIVLKLGERKHIVSMGIKEVKR